MVFGPSGRDPDSLNQYYLSWETPGYSKSFKKKPEPFSNISFGEISKYRKVKMLEVGKDGGEHPEDSLYKSSRILKCDKYLSNKHATGIW